MEIRERVEQVARELDRYAYRFRTEAELHLRVEQVLRSAEIPSVREYALGASRFDFFLQGLVIEVKVGGSRAEALRQADRYCECPEVEGVLIAAATLWGQERGACEFRGKPVQVVWVRRAAF